MIARLNMGGPALHVAYLTDGLAERGYDTTLVAGTVGHGEQSMAYVAESLGVQVVTIPHLHREISPVQDLLATIRLARMMRADRPTILHTHTAKAGAVGRVAALLAGRARPPIVVHTFHGHVLRGYFGRFWTFVFRMLERMLAHVTDALVAVSPEVRDELVALGVAPASKFTVIRLGIELESRRPGARGGARRDPPGDGRPRRPLPRRLDGADDRREAHGRRPARVRAPPRARRATRRCAWSATAPTGAGSRSSPSELGIVRDCLFTGYQEDVGPFFAAFDVFVLPSANEGTPVTAIEALASGCPVVATRVGGVPDVVHDGEDGILIDPGSPEQLADALVRLAGDPELRARMGAAGRERTLPRYAVSRLIDDVDALYRELLDRKGFASV